MGCDIHLFAEVKRDGVWTHEPGEFYDGRNYDLFGILADVRNRNELTPISDRIGWPDDVCEYAKDYSYDMDYHSHGHLTVAELIAFDWTQTVEVEYLGIPPEVVTYYSLCDYWWSNTMPRLLALGAPEDVRIVFCFDS